MRFRTGKYDAHEGQQRPMHQITVRINDVQDVFIHQMFGEAGRVILVRDGTNSAILRRALPKDRNSTKIGKVGETWGVSFHETYNEWVALVSPGWALTECETFTDHDNKQIRFIFPAVDLRQPPRKMHRTVRAAPVPVVEGETGQALLYIGDKSYTCKSVPLSMLEGIKRMVGVDNWE